MLSKTYLLVLSAALAMGLPASPGCPGQNTPVLPQTGNGKSQILTFVLCLANAIMIFGLTLSKARICRILPQT